MSIFSPDSEYYIYPKDIPPVLIKTLVIICLLFGLSPLRHGTSWQDWLNVFEEWLFILIIVPTATATFALPVKYRDPNFELKLAYYLGIFVAFLYTLAKLRYWR